MTSESVEKEQFQKVPRNKMQRTFTFLLSTIIVGLLLIVATGETSHDYALEYQSQGYTSTGGGHYARRSPASRRSSPKVMHKRADAGGDFKTVGEEYEAHLEDSMNLLKEKDYGINSFMLVHTGEMHVSIKQENIPSVSKEIDSIVKDVGEGYYENKGHMNVGTDYERLVMTIRVRTDSFQKVIDGIRKVSDSVISLSTRSKDVTDEFVDASARADALEAARTSIRAIMTKADNVNEVLKIQQELNRLTEASESHRQRAQTLQKQAEYSTLDLQITLKGTVLSWTPFSAASTAVEQLFIFFQGIANILIYFSVWIIPLGFLTCLIYLILSAILRRMVVRS